VVSASLLRTHLTLCHCSTQCELHRLTKSTHSNISQPQLAPEKFVEDSTQEACRMIPMSIRITGYSKSPIPPDSTIRPLPTIHVEGESIGSDRSLRDVRKVKGTVGMIGDGAIRWSLVSCTLLFAWCRYTLRTYYTNTSPTQRCLRRRAPVSQNGRRSRCRLGGQVRRSDCWECGQERCMRGRIRLVSARVSLSMRFTH
jgi:hypothetical protein